MVFIKYNNELSQIDTSTLNSSDLKLVIKDKYNIEDFYLIYNTKLLHSNIIELTPNDTIEVINRVKGGILDILEPIFAPILNPFKDMILAIVDIVLLVLEVIKLIPKILEAIVTIFSPDKLLNDVIYGSITGINSMISFLFGKLGFVGGDKTKEDGSGGVFGIDDPKKAVCVKPTLLKLVLLVACPPLALYIERGLSSFFLVIICGLMTYYMYYFPGFLFAALHIIC